MSTDAALQTTGLDDIVKFFGEFDDRTTEAAVKVMAAHGGSVVSAAAGIAPKRTGAMAAALSITPTQFPGGPGFTLSIGSNIVPYAYTYHSGIIGKTTVDPMGVTSAPKVSGGYMVFRVGAHQRAGHFVSGYSARRKITLNPYLFTAWFQLRTKLDQAITTAIAGVM